MTCGVQVGGLSSQEFKGLCLETRDVLSSLVEEKVLCIYFALPF